MRFITDRPLLVKVALGVVFLCVLLGVWLMGRREKPLSAEEARLVGKWKWVVVGAPPTATNAIAFLPNRRLGNSGITGMQSRWSISNNHLKIEHYYKTTAFGVVLPMKTVESFSWTITSMAEKDCVKLTSDGRWGDSVMTRERE